MESLPLQPFLQSLHKEQWQEVRLGEVAEIVNGYAFKSKEFLNIQQRDSLPIIKIKNVANGDVNLNDVVFYPYSKQLEKFLIKYGDILVSLTGNHPQAQSQVVGQISKYKYKQFALLNQRVAKIVTKDAEQDFLYYLLKTNKIHNILASHSSGSANQANISSKDIENLTIPLPPLTIQQKIAEILSSFDDKIDLLHRQNKTLESLALTLFRHYFIDNPNRSEWEEVSLNSLCEITSSKRIFYSEYVEYGIPFYRSKEIIEFSKGNNPQNELFIDENKYNDIANKFGVPQANDILLTSVGTLGIPYLVPKDKKFYFKDGNLTWFKNFKNITSLFLFYWFKSPQGKEKLDSIAIGSTQQALTIAALKAVNIHLPHTDIIRILNEQLNGIQNKIENNTKQIQNLQAMRDMLLKAIFA
ncbi:restriction endonuclease subunit S [Helicobacter winghamensis]|uniref:restriction endonuclease subunit S n=3 Tax=Helicobacter winghamensis TaxID=157268 RepID=UPI000C6E62DD|nr:restriction endonuclease subunit S [Helicobacter winghamensis]